MYFQYLTVGVEAAVTCIDACIEFVPRSPHWRDHLANPNSDCRLKHELMFIGFSKLLFHDMVHHKRCPSYARRVIDLALENYPHNPDLVSLFVAVESRYADCFILVELSYACFLFNCSYCRFRVAGRVRRYFEQNLRSDDVNVLVLVLGIATDLFSNIASTGAVRSVFERATEQLQVT